MSAYPMRLLGKCACGRNKVRRHASARYCADCAIERYDSPLAKERRYLRDKANRLTSDPTERRALMISWGVA